MDGSGSWLPRGTFDVVQYGALNNVIVFVRKLDFANFKHLVFCVHMRPFPEVERPRQDFKRSFQAIQLQGLDATLGWSYRSIPNLPIIAALQAGLRSV